MEGPDFILAGGHKCATTSIYSLLREHPGANMSSFKEPHYFARRSLEGRLHRGVWNADEYTALWPARSRTGVLNGEASVLYLSFADEVVGTITQECDKTPRIILSLRNPVDRAWSSFVDSKLTNPRESARDFDEAVEREISRGAQRMEGEGLPTLRHLALGFYSSGVETFVNAFGPELVHVVLFEEFREHPESVFSGLEKFLGLESIPLPDQSPQNAGGRQWRAGFTSRIATSEFAMRSRRTAARVSPKLHAQMRQRALRHLTEPVASMRPETRDMLMALYRSDVEKLGSLLSRDLNAWAN